MMRADYIRTAEVADLLRTGSTVHVETDGTGVIAALDLESWDELVRLAKMGTQAQSILDGE